MVAISPNIDYNRSTERQRAFHDQNGVVMAKPRIPELLWDWLDSREHDPEKLSDDVLYSAALELQYDMEYSGDYDDTPPAKKAAVTRYVNRMSKNCTIVPLYEWY